MISISVLVATRNRASYLRGCLDSLLAQTVIGRTEIIVIGYSSSKQERDIISEYRLKRPQIRSIFTKKPGIYHAWNLGIKYARGKYITNLNSDDRLGKKALEIMKDALDNNPDVALVYGDSYITRKPYETFYRNSSGGRTTDWPDYSRKELLLGCICGPHPMWRKNVHKTMGYFDEKYVSAGDYEFWLRISEKYKILHVPKTIGLYYENPRGVSLLNLDNAHDEIFSIQRKYLKLR